MQRSEIQDFGTRISPYNNMAPYRLLTRFQVLVPVIWNECERSPDVGGISPFGRNDRDGFVGAGVFVIHDQLLLTVISNNKANHLKTFAFICGL